MVSETRLDGTRLYPPGHGTRRPERSPGARHRASSQGHDGGVVGESPRKGGRLVTVGTSARSGAPNRGGDCTDPHSRRPKLRRSSRPSCEKTRERIVACHAHATPPEASRSRALEK